MAGRNDAALAAALEVMANAVGNQNNVGGLASYPFWSKTELW